ncbi:MAG TPA: class I SAM-dependent methyltransferase [Pyrinomonadaceae bacterium]|nr:class I SAM-dependent methyltransferase [Pyrinomonadaceae bacterium]
MAMEDGTRRGLSYSVLRAGFRALPRPLRSALLEAFNSVRQGTPLKRFKLRVVSRLGRHNCPVCGGRVWRFLPLPDEYLEELRRYNYKYTTEDAETCNARGYSCPHCDAADRDRLYALYLRDYFREVAPSDTVKLLDFAPSPPLSRFIRTQIADSPHSFTYRTADLFAEGVNDRVDITDMKIYAQESVDFFICSHVLEHVTDDAKALRELYRILKPGGRGILVVPIVLSADEIDEDPSVTDPAERWRRFGQGDHVRLYSKQGFVSRVREAGFTLHQFGPEYFGERTFERHGITNRSVLYIVEKA